MQETSCKNCTVKEVCYLEKHRRMYKHKCYIDALAGKIGKSKSQIMGLMRAFIDETGFGMEDCIPLFEDSWNKLGESSKMAEIHDVIIWMQIKRKRWDATYIPCGDSAIINRYCTITVALLNTYFNSWRNEDYVRCLRCGEVFKNNKQHNRKYCDNCRGYQRKIYVWRTCPDCGDDFIVTLPNNRQYRCPDCQRDGDKLVARQRAKKYRERKNHAIN